jgi:hypothetical protein
MARKEVLSLRQVRLASRRGHIIIVQPGIPTQIPEALFLEAAKNGCVDYNPQMVEAFKAAVASAARNDAASPAVTKTAVDAAKLAKDAVRQVMLAGMKGPELLTSTGLPRLPAVRAAYDELCGVNHVEPELKITTDLIGAMYLDIQDEGVPEKAEDSSSRYPAGIPAGDLEGEEVGGDLEGALARVSDTEE